MKANDKKMKKFWDSSDGRFIRGYGVVLALIGLLGVALLGATFLIAAFSQDPSQTITIDFLLWLIPPILLYLIYIVCGLRIKYCAYSPNKFRIINIGLIILSLMSVVYNYGQVTLLNLVVLIGAALYQFGWHKVYAEAYDAQAKLADKPKKSKKK